MSNFVLTPNAVAKLRRAIAPRSGNTGAVAATGLPIDPDKFPPPFTVRWSASAANGAGAWVIWLPDKAQLVMFEGVYLNIGGVTAEQALPEGWYTIDDAETSSDEVWLVVTITKRGSGEIVSVDVELSTAEGQAVTGETVQNILVAEMDVDADTGAKRTKQYVDSAVLLCPGESGVTPDEISTEFIPDPPSGTQPDGDEGKLQIKGFKSGQPTDINTLPGYLQGAAAIPSGGISIVCRGMTSGRRMLFYLPLDALDLSDYAKKTDLPTVNDGTLTIKQGSTTLGTFTANQATGTTVTIPEPPTPPTINDGTLTIKQGSTTLGTFTANQATGTTVTIPEPPTPPTVNDGTLTIKQGSTTLGTFTANQATGTTVTIPEPPSFPSGSLTVITDERYDVATKQLQVKTRTLTFSAAGIALGNESNWTMITGGQAVPHSAEA